MAQFNTPLDFAGLQGPRKQYRSQQNGMDALQNYHYNAAYINHLDRLASHNASLGSQNTHSATQYQRSYNTYHNNFCLPQNTPSVPQYRPQYQQSYNAAQYGYVSQEGFVNLHPNPHLRDFHSAQSGYQVAQSGFRGPIQMNYNYLQYNHGAPLYNNVATQLQQQGAPYGDFANSQQQHQCSLQGAGFTPVPNVTPTHRIPARLPASKLDHFPPTTHGTISQPIVIDDDKIITPDTATESETGATKHSTIAVEATEDNDTLTDKTVLMQHHRALVAKKGQLLTNDRLIRQAQKAVKAAVKAGYHDYRDWIPHLARELGIGQNEVVYMVTGGKGNATITKLSDAETSKASKKRKVSHDANKTESASSPTVDVTAKIESRPAKGGKNTAATDTKAVTKENLVETGVAQPETLVVDEHPELDEGQDNAWDEMERAVIEGHQVVDAENGARAAKERKQAADKKLREEARVAQHQELICQRLMEELKNITRDKELFGSDEDDDNDDFETQTLLEEAKAKLSPEFLRRVYQQYEHHSRNLGVLVRDDVAQEDELLAQEIEELLQEDYQPGQDGEERCDQTRSGPLWMVGNPIPESDGEISEEE